MSEKEFVLKGTVSGAIRSDEDMLSIDKIAADDAFKLHKKQLDAFLKECGFVKYKTNSYLRKNKLNVLEYIDLQKESYGSKTFTVNYALIPLYVPHKFFSFALSDRLGKLICDKDVWWDYSDDAKAAVSFDNVMDAVDSILIPWFDQHASVEVLNQELLSLAKTREAHGGRLSDTQQAWLEALDDNKDRSDIIEANREILKLPAKLFLCS